MRYQERIYIQNQNSAVRNRGFNNFNMSSDICVFNNPLYNISGTTILNCCVCPDTLVGHDTYSGGTVILPTTVTWTDCEDPLVYIRGIRDAAMAAFSISGQSVLQQFIEVEELNCGRIVKWKDIYGDDEVWTVNQIDGTFENYLIFDYTNTQNTIQKATTSGYGTQCCDNQYANTFTLWNNFLDTITLTGNTNYYIDLPYTSATSCNVAKIPCTTGSTLSGASYIISADTQTIPLTFNFTANTQTFIDTNANFRYQIYKYDNTQESFNGIPVYKSETLQYSAFSATNTTTQYIPSSGITIDGDYMIKGFYQFSACTDFMKRLGKGVDTINYIYGDQYGIYDKNLDYYFVAVKQAEIPNFVNNLTNDSPANSLIQAVLFPDAGIQYLAAPTNTNGAFLLTLNGLILAKDYDYTVSGSVVTLNGTTEEDDIVSFIYTTYGGPNLVSDNIDVATTIVSGVTNGQGSNLVYYNTTNNKYEVYTSVTPAEGNAIILMVNGVTLASQIDYYQSTTNPKRIILEGDLVVGDIITIVYFPSNGTVNGLNTNIPTVTWTINDLPQKNNGFFSLEVSTGNTFSNFYYSGHTNYDTASNYYSDSFIASGTVGTKLYYRVKNEKNYETLCGDFVTSIVYSDIIPVVIQSNSINSY